MPFFTAIVAWLRRKPFIFTLHGYPKQKGIGKIFQTLYKFFAASIFLRIASKVIVVSRTSIPDIEKEVNASKIVYVPNGIEAEEFDCTDFTKNKRIIYVGRLDRDKGIDSLIRAFAEVKKKFPDFTLVIAGPDEGVKKELEALANRLGVKPEFVNVPYEKIHELYCSAFAVVLPSRYEGFSLVWLEAMASGRPMLSTPVGEAPKLFEQAYSEKKNMFLFNDEKELGEKLIAILQNPDSIIPAVKSAEETVKAEYSWENVAAIIKRVYEETYKK
jgi:glycosyltransferase involved in cell wall biosynthesis